MSIPQTYLITNNINGKVYVGQTVNLKKRWQSYKSSYNNQKSTSYKTSLSRAMRKYGFDNFTIEIISYYNSIVEAKQAEIFWIAEMRNYLGKNNVYNQTSGGDGSLGLKPSDETRQKMSKSLIGNSRTKGKPKSPETRAKMSAAAKGKPKSKEAAAKSAAARKGRKRSPESITKFIATMQSKRG